MLEQSKVILAFCKLSKKLVPENEILSAAINRTYVGNNWLTSENYWLAITNWNNILTIEELTKFSTPYNHVTPLRIGIVMAGNIPMVGFHDLLCTLLSGHQATVKPSSDDKYVIEYICRTLLEIEPTLNIQIVERLNQIDAVIATGSNNSFRYFEHYFKNIPSLLRKNRKSIAVLNGSESDKELKLLADDVFQYYGLGCRNVSLIALPRAMDITRILDFFMEYEDLKNHNKYANNYTYHRALLLMNQEQHLDTGFALPKERKELNAPLACIHYWYYDSTEEIDSFILDNKEEIQCIVGNYSNPATVPFGESQTPDLQDFADNINTLDFLSKLK